MTDQTLYRYPGSGEEYDNLLFSYAAGQLNETLSLMVETHLHFSREARKMVARMERVGGALLEAHCPQTQLSETCFDHLMSKIDAFEHTPHRPIRQDETQCQRTREALACLAKCEETKELVAYLLHKLPAAHENTSHDGFHILEIGAERNQPHSEVNYVTGDAAGIVPYHTHNGLEITLVLDGTLEDEGITYSRGALLIADEGVSHTPRVAGSRKCVCLVFSDNPLRLLTLMLTLLGSIL